MAGNEITVVARLKAQQGKEEQLVGEVTALLAPTRAEEGCINYDLHSSLDDPSLFFLYETWRSKQALDEHLATPYLQAFLGKAPELLAGDVDITLWKLML